MRQITSMPRIAVIGGGWYGCHLVRVLHEAGYEVSGFEKTGTLLTGAAANNQLRLHQGFHYLRSGVTRRQALKGFSDFVASYPSLSETVAKNIYAVPFLESDLDAETIELILQGAKIPFSKLPVSDFPWLKGIEALYQCEERLINVEKARHFFLETIGDRFEFNHEVGFAEIKSMRSTGRFDYVVDATYFAIEEITPKATHEVTVLGQFRSSSSELRGGLTLIDGKLWSIYPTNTAGLYSLSHVKHSIMGQFETQAAAELARGEMLAGKTYEPHLEAMRNHVLGFFPSLSKDLADLNLRFITRKLKPLGNSATREALAVEIEPGLVLVQPGKIDAMIATAQQVLEILKTSELTPHD